ncbi:hypothetical protein UT300003_32510 [Clostridium sardiniense]
MGKFFEKVLMVAFIAFIISILCIVLFGALWLLTLGINFVLASFCSVQISVWVTIVAIACLMFLKFILTN